MSITSECNRGFLRAVWSLYCKYGLKEFPNYILLRYDHINRDELISALQCPDIQKSAIDLIEEYKGKIAELEEVLAEATRLHAATHEERLKP